VPNPAWDRIRRGCAVLYRIFNSRWRNSPVLHLIDGVTAIAASVDHRFGVAGTRNTVCPFRLIAVPDRSPTLTDAGLRTSANWPVGGRPWRLINPVPAIWPAPTARRAQLLDVTCPWVDPPWIRGPACWSNKKARSILLPKIAPTPMRSAA
jgi:hypothetical protein